MADREKLIEAVNSFKFPIESGGCTIGEYIVPYSIQEPLADHLIANGVTIQKWIPVTERLPEEGGKFLVCGSRGGIYTAEFWNHNGYPHWHKLNSKNHYCEPTHWTPLPEPPKGE